MSTDRDPLQYVTDALALLPDDPAQATVDDLGRIAAMTEGLARHTFALRADMAALARRARDCDENLAELEAIAAERNRLDAEYQRAQVADQRFTTYAADALSAHGFDLDRLMAGD